MWKDPSGSGLKLSAVRQKCKTHLEHQGLRQDSSQQVLIRHASVAQKLSCDRVTRE
jgi:hypothetical protein